MRNIIIENQDALPTGEDITSFIRAQRSQHLKKAVSFNRYPSEMAFMRYQEQELLNKKLILERTNSNRMDNISRTSMGRFSVKERPPTALPKKFNQHKMGQNISRFEPNSNILRMTKQVRSSLRQLPKSQPFKVVRSLSLKTLKNKAEVQHQRLLRQRLQQRNPFAPHFLQTQFLQ